MGFRGLKSFMLKNEKKFFKDINFQDTKVIIDGNSLMYFLAKINTNSSRFGISYNQYRLNIDIFFKNLKKCKIEPMVILDGCKTKFKLKRLIHRHENKLKSCIESTSSSTHDGEQGAIPLLMKQEFFKGLIRNNVEPETSDFEADDKIVELANHHKVYVLSNDSDYFIYNLHKSVARFDLLNFNELKKNYGDGGYFITGKVFFKKRWELDPQLIALGGMLLGNDYLTFPRDHLKMFLDKMGKKSTTQEDEDIIELTFSWLKEVGSYEDALNKFKDHIKTFIENWDNSFWEILEKNVQKYVENRTDFENTTKILSNSGKEIPGKLIFFQFLLKD